MARAQYTFMNGYQRLALESRLELLFGWQFGPAWLATRAVLAHPIERDSGGVMVVLRYWV